MNENAVHRYFRYEYFPVNICFIYMHEYFVSVNMTILSVCKYEFEI